MTENCRLDADWITFVDLKTGVEICTMEERIYCMRQHYGKLLLSDSSTAPNRYKLFFFTLLSIEVDFWTVEDGLKLCGCKLACKQSEYIPKITTYKYLSSQVLSMTGFSSGIYSGHLLTVNTNY